MTKTAVILAGGRGERLMPHTQNKPKVMVELLDRPMIAWQLAWLKSYGIENVIIAAGYKADVLKDYLGDGAGHAMKISYSIEKEPLGTGGALKQALDLVKENTVIIANGDIISDCDLDAMARAHDESGALVTIMAVRAHLPWDVLVTNELNQVVQYEQKPQLEQRVSGGIFVMRTKIQKDLPELGDHEATFLRSLSKEQFRAFLFDGQWYAVDTSKDKTRAEAYLQKIKTSTK